MCMQLNLFARPISLLYRGATSLIRQVLIGDTHIYMGVTYTSHPGTFMTTAATEERI